MKLKALKYMRYASQKVQAGEVFEAKAADVRVLLAVKHAVPYVEPVVPRKQPKSFVAVAPYFTQDGKTLVGSGFSISESLPQAVSAVDDLAALGDDPPMEAEKPKRAYRRKDMVAE